MPIFKDEVSEGNEQCGSQVDLRQRFLLAKGRRGCPSRSNSGAGIHLVQGAQSDRVEQGEGLGFVIRGSWSLEVVDVDR